MAVANAVTAMIRQERWFRRVSRNHSVTSAISNFTCRSGFSPSGEWGMAKTPELLFIERAGMQIAAWAESLTTNVERIAPEARRLDAYRHASRYCLDEKSRQIVHAKCLFSLLPVSFAIRSFVCVKTHSLSGRSRGSLVWQHDLHEAIETVLLRMKTPLREIFP